jgi:beta-galactosidase
MTKTTDFNQGINNMIRTTFCSVLVAILFIPQWGFSQTSGQTFTPPITPRVILSMNPDWKFIRQDVPDAQTPNFDDSKWTTVSTPHSYNETDSFRTIISHGGGDRGTYKGIGWYRKHFKVPAEYAGRELVIEFEGMRQAGDIYLNGKEVGLYENGITAYGVDISKGVRFNGEDNILAVKVDNRTNYQERATGTGFEWNANDFNPDHGGINRRVWLHVMGKIHQTLPLYYGLETIGTYIYSGNFNIPGRTCDVTVESQVHNDSADRATASLSVVVVDRDGKVQAKFDGDALDMVAGEKSVLSATGPLKDARFWSVEDPNLYEVYTIVNVDGKAVDVVKNTTGFRKVEFKGGAGTGGVYLNDKFVYLKGFSQRSSDEWAGLGQGYPDWMHDLNAQILRGCFGNYMRWMHISPQKIDVEAYDRAGIIEVCPAGDKEADPVLREKIAAENAARRGGASRAGTARASTWVPSATAVRQWDQRAEVMRDSMIYFRNSPSILFWEAGNTVVTPEHMQQMVDIRKQWDPQGQRVMGTRGDSNDSANTAITPVAEYFGVMIGQDRQTENVKNPGDIFRGFSAERRDRAPIIETEDFRDEAGRRFWDDFSPPHFGFKKGPMDTYNWNSETFALAGAARYWAYWSNRISNPNANHARWSGYASIYFIDSNADGRQDSSEVCRVSGKVDAVRLPKELYFVHRVMQNQKPDLHIIGHWTYPAGTKKTMYVAANNVDAVEFFVNDASKGKVTTPKDGYIYAFPDIAFEAGVIRAVGYSKGEEVCKQELNTAGTAKRIKLTPMVGPQGLQADGEDVALITFEVVDANGERCPTDEARVDFTCTGPANWRGGYNSGIIDTTNNLYLNTECGVNRVAVRSTLKAGSIVVTASRPGLESAKIEIASKPTVVKDGLTTEMPRRLAISTPDAR